MTKQTIEVEGLADDVKITKIRYVSHHGVGAMNWVVETEKIQPRRIVLEETNEERRICFGEWYESQEGKLMRWPYGGKTDGKHKVWREVKETNEEPKLSLSVDECKEAMRKLETFNVTDLSVKICRFLKDK